MKEASGEDASMEDASVEDASVERELGEAVKGIPILWARGEAYGVGNEGRSDCAQPTRMGSATIRPVASVVVLYTQVFRVCPLETMDVKDESSRYGRVSPSEV